MAQVLIVSDNQSDTDRLKAAFRAAGFEVESANSMEEGCKSAKSGRFQVIFSSPILDDGSWTRLIEVANQRGLSLEIVLLARHYDLSQWAAALGAGAFDVLDVFVDLPNAAEAANRALGAYRSNRIQSAHGPM